MADERIAKLYAEIGADLSKLEKGLKEAEQKIAEADRRKKELTLGVDSTAVDAALEGVGENAQQASAEVAEVQRQLDALEADAAGIDINADASGAVREVQRLERSVEAVDRKGRQADGGLDGITKTALRAVAGFGAMELGLGAVNAGAAALSGNIEDAAEQVKQLPAGIGPFTRQLETTLGIITGIKKETEAALAAAERGNALLALQIANVRERASVEREVADLAKEQARTMALLNAPSDQDRERLRLEFEAADKLEALDRRRAALKEQLQDKAAGAAEADLAAQKQIADLQEQIRAREEGLGFIVTRQTTGVDEDVANFRRQIDDLQAEVDLRERSRTAIAEQIAEVERLRAAQERVNEAVIQRGFEERRAAQLAEFAAADAEQAADAAKQQTQAEAEAAKLAEQTAREKQRAEAEAQRAAAQSMEQRKREAEAAMRDAEAEAERVRDAAERADNTTARDITGQRLVFGGGALSSVGNAMADAGRRAQEKAAAGIENSNALLREILNAVKGPVFA